MAWAGLRGPARFEMNYSGGLTPPGIAVEGEFRDGANSIAGVVRFDDTTEIAPYEGTRCMKFYTVGDASGGTHYGRVAHSFQSGPDWPGIGNTPLGPTNGDTFWIGCALFLPTGYKAKVPGNVTFMRVDNYGSQPNYDRDGYENRHYLNVRIANNRLEVSSQDLKTSPGEQPGLLCDYNILENQWNLVEVKFQLSATTPRTELWVNGAMVDSDTTKRNFYNTFDRLRIGIPSIYQQVQTIAHYIDWAYISPIRLGPPVPVLQTAPTGTVVPPFIGSSAQLGTGWEDVDVVKFWIDPPQYQIDTPFQEFSMTGLNRPPHWPPYTGCKFGGQKFIDSESEVVINTPISLTAGTHVGLAQAWSTYNVGGVGDMTVLKGQDTISFTVP